MNKLFWFIGGALVVVLVLGVSSVAFAQTAQPPQPAQPGYAGMGMMGGGFARGGMMRAGGFGPIHTYMVESLASKLGLTVDEINSRLGNGETMLQIAQSTGLDADKLAEVLDAAHDEALEKAVAAGVLTQEQADWMEQRMNGANGAYGAGGCLGGSNRGAGRGFRWQQTQPQPTN